MNEAKKSPSSLATEQNSPPSTPRWVKVFGIIIVVLVLLFVGLQFLSGGRHGPGRHLPASTTPPIENTRQ
jgi:hypothetical protein